MSRGTNLVLQPNRDEPVEGPPWHNLHGCNLEGHEPKEDKAQGQHIVISSCECDPSCEMHMCYIQEFQNIAFLLEIGL